MNSLSSLSIRHINPEKPREEVWEHGVIWHGVHEIKIDLGDVHWYGGGALVHQQYPLEKLAQYLAPFITSDNGTSGLLGILHPFWWTSSGIGILVENDELSVGFNAPLEGQPIDHSFSFNEPFDNRPQLADGLATTHALHIKGDNLSIRFFEMENPRQVVEAFWQLLDISPPPPNTLLEKPLWTTWAYFKNSINHEKIVRYANNLIQHGFTGSVFGIDAKWQSQFGDTQFDLQKFPAPQATIVALHDLGFDVTLWCMPFFMTDSVHFKEVTERSYVIQTEDGQPYIGEWWEGQAAFLDVTNPDAMTWHLNNLSLLAEEVGNNGYKFDAGEAMFYDIPDTRRQDMDAANRATHLYINQTASRFPWSDSRSGWHSQSRPMLFRQWDKSTGWGYDNGLASCITQAITLNMLGYPYSFPDMIGGNQYGEDIPTAELLIRWTQAVAPMPIIQFSIPPWEFGEECTTICRDYVQLHHDIAQKYTIPLAAQQKPIVCPLWWIAPMDPIALTCADQYLIGETVLVAPVIKEGARQRDIYLPAGKWRSYWDNDETYEGHQWLHQYPVPLDKLVLFEKII